VSVERLPDDPGICVREEGPDHVEVTVGDDWVIMSRYNARRVLGALSIILELPLTKAAAKSIKM
jgi:hypothetical protein